MQNFSLVLGLVFIVWYPSMCMQCSFYSAVFPFNPYTTHSSRCSLVQRITFIIVETFAKEVKFDKFLVNFVCSYFVNRNQTNFFALLTPPVFILSVFLVQSATHVFQHSLYCHPANWIPSNSKSTSLASVTWGIKILHLYIPNVITYIVRVCCHEVWVNEYMQHEKHSDQTHFCLVTNEQEHFSCSKSTHTFCGWEILEWPDSFHLMWTIFFTSYSITPSILT